MVTYSLKFLNKKIIIVPETIWKKSTEGVKRPTPVDGRRIEKAKKSDVSRGTIVREWMQKADAYDSALFKNNIKTDGDE